MRIVIGADTYYPNVDGASYFTQHLAVYLAKKWHEILVIAPSKTRENKFFTHEGVNIFSIKSWPTFFHKSYRFTMPFFIKKDIEDAIAKFNPDIVHVQGHFFIESEVARIARKLKIPLVGTNHFMPENLVHYLRMPAFIEKMIIWVAWKQFKLVFSKIPTVTTPTQTAANVLKKIGLTQNIMPLSCGIDLAKFRPDNKCDYLRERYAIPNKPVVLCVGRLAPEKNVDQIIRAIAIVNKKTPVQLVAAGLGTERGRLEQLAESLNIKDCVTFAGFVPDEDLPNLYCLATIFVMAGAVELQSLVTMEAMASGVPVIAADALALPELAHHGENGYLFKLGDIESLAKYIENIAADKSLHDKMAAKSLELIQRHDINKTIAKFEEIYTGLIAKQTN